MTEDPSNQPYIAGKKIAVIGGGLAGLAFVISMRKQWPHEYPFPAITVYERDTKEAIGREGYSISIRGDASSGGMQALQKMGILDAALSVSITGSVDPKDRGGFCFWDTRWNQILTFARPEADITDGMELGMRIARSKLRDTLIGTVEEHNSADIRWGVQCKTVEKAGDKVRVQLNNGLTDECDLVIACDGANSTIRNIVRPDDKLSFAGPVIMSATSRFPLHKVPSPMNRNWGIVLGGGGTGLFVSPVDSRSALWSMSYLAKEPRKKTPGDLSGKQIDELLQEAASRGASFHEPFAELLQATDTSTLRIINAMDKQPFPNAAVELPIIFIGDSNHAMNPFSANGANMALRDGFDLAEQLCKAQPLRAALRAYDHQSMPRSRKAIDGSRWAISGAHATGLKLVGYRIALKILSFILWMKG